MVWPVYIIILLWHSESSLGLFVDIKGATDRFLANHRCKNFDWWPIRRADEINTHDAKMPAFTSGLERDRKSVNDKQSVQMMKNKYTHKEIHKIMKRTDDENVS